MTDRQAGEFPLSKDWSVPAELQRPTASVVSNLVIIMLASEMMGNDLIELVGELQAEHARFNKWCGGFAKSSLESSEISRRSSEARVLIRSLYMAWSSFSRKFEDGGRKRLTAIDERSALKVALREANQGLAALREA